MTLRVTTNDEVAYGAARRIFNDLQLFSKKEKYV